MELSLKVVLNLLETYLNGGRICLEPNPGNGSVITKEMQCQSLK
jgi:hypothetical protein